MKLNGKITISRPVYSSEKEVISILIEDDNSHIRFLDLEMSYSDFTKVLTGQSYLPVEMEVRGLDNVGKIKESKDLIFKVPDFMSGEDFAEKNCQEYVDLGWKPNVYFRSQNSIRKHENDEYFAYGTQFRYV